MREDNCVDFNDLILKPLLAFERDPKMARAWARQFDAIMVDEYQDTNKGQYRLLRFLTEGKDNVRSEEHTSELQSLMRISYAVFCLKKNNTPEPDLSNLKD